MTSKAASIKKVLDLIDPAVEIFEMQSKEKIDLNADIQLLCVLV